MKNRHSPWSRALAVLAITTLATAIVPALAIGPAQAATQTVTITKAGYVPDAVTLTTGDTVTFSNTDAVVRQIEFKQTAGFTCTVNPLVVQPAAQQSCTFTVAGTYTYSDPKEKGATFRGTVTVNPAVVPSVTLAPSSSVVRYGNPITLNGKVVPQGAGTSVDILALEYGASAYVKVAAAVTVSTGAFDAAVTPQIRTTYRAEFVNAGKAITSAEVSVQVRPRVSLVLRDLAGRYGYFTTKALSTLSYAGTKVFAQRRNSTGGWTTLKVVTLGQFSSARFKVALPRGDSRIRVLLPASAAGPGYLAGFSRGVLVAR